jgi:hypothetical protein
MAALNKYPNKLAWRRRRTCERGRPCGTEILTPFGLAEVWDIGGFAVLRNDAPLYHSTCRTGRFGGDNARRASIFLSHAAAQAAAELHLALGWGDYARKPDCLAFDWDDDNLVCLDGPPRIRRTVRAADVDDEQTWGWEERERCRPWGYPFWLARCRRADRIVHPMVQRRLWQQFAGRPAWCNEAKGWFTLKTPYGELVVRRENDVGWIAERNGIPLCYGHDEAGIANLKVVFDDYQDAQTLALLWVFPRGRHNTLHWNDDKPDMAAA